MKILHTGDLHIGKCVNNFSMLKDQKEILSEMVELAVKYHVQAFVIAGDIYDRAIPTAEAVTVMNDFLVSLQQNGIEVMMISGNHDSPERIGFAEKILEQQSIHIAGIYDGTLKQVTLEDEYGEVIFTLMPYVKAPVLQSANSQEAVEKMLKAIDQKSGLERSVLVTHFFVTNNGKEPELSDSETQLMVGGLDSVDCSVFQNFSYTALGHIHKPQQMNHNGAPVVYAGSPLAYSFSECGQEKSVVLVELDRNGQAAVQRLPLHPLHEMRKMKGSLQALVSQEVSKIADQEDYLQITLTDEEELIDPMGTLRSVYPNIMQLLFEKKNITDEDNDDVLRAVKKKSTEELFEDFYHLLRDKDMDDARKNVMKEVIGDIS